MLSSLERLLSPKSYKLRKLITELILLAQAAGLPQNDVKNASEALEYNEGGVALDTLLVQLFEYDINIDDGFVAKARIVCQAMKIDWSEYKFVETLANRR